MGILGDILDLSKIESEQFTLEPVPVALAEIARGIEVVFVPPCAAKGVGMSVHWDTNLPQVKVDRLRLDQVLYNLVGNAVKFTEKGEVRVEFLLLTQQEGRVTVRFTVQDTGIGMDTEQQSRLFRPFTQADQGISRKYGGTGLGLSISQNLVRLMGGLIQVESAPGRGSLFRFELVLTMEAESSASTTEKPVLPDWKGRRAFVVEDNAVSRAVALGLLRKLGLEAFAVEDGAQALECLQAETFDIVFMDVQMPVMDGLSASRELRSRGYRGPILALSAGATAEERKAVIEAGMDGYLEKPLLPEKLRAALRSAVQWKTPGSDRPKE